MDIIEWLDAEGTPEAHMARDEVESLRGELEAVKQERDTYKQCNKTSYDALTALRAELADEKLHHHQTRDRWAAALAELEAARLFHERENQAEELEAAKKDTDTWRQKSIELGLEASELGKQRDSLLAALIEMVEASEEPPDRNCSCHISPPCNDCVDNSCLREAFEMARAAIAKVGAGKTGET